MNEENIRAIFIAFSLTVMFAIINNAFNISINPLKFTELEFWTCIEWKNETVYQNYGINQAIPNECKPTGGCGCAVPCKDATCGYICVVKVCLKEGLDCVPVWKYYYDDKKDEHAWEIIGTDCEQERLA